MEIAKSKIDEMFKIINDYVENLSTTFLYNYIREIYNGMNLTKAQEFIEEEIEKSYLYYLPHITEEVFLKTSIKIHGISDTFKEKLLLATKLKIIKYNEDEDDKTEPLPDLEDLHFGEEENEKESDI